MPSLIAQVIPTGGAVALTLTTATSGVITLSRATSGFPAGSGLSAFSTLYSGAPFANELMPDGKPFATPYFDTGDLLPAPLNPSQLYVYQLIDVNGSVQTPPILPAVELTIQPDPLTQILIRLLQAGINSLAPSSFNISGGKIPQVLYDMPLAGFPPMPFVTVNLDLLQQEQIPIGQSVQKTNSAGNWVITGFAKFAYRISVLANSSPERDFYRDAVVAIFRSILASVFQPLGRDITHRYQIANGQVVKEKQLEMPGFYYADVMLEFSGTFNTLITINYGIINTIIFTGTTPDGTEIQVQVPP